MSNQKEMMRQKGYIPAVEAAARAGLSLGRVYELLNEGKLKGMNVPPDSVKPRRYVLASSLVDYLGPDAAKALGLVKQGAK